MFDTVDNVLDALGGTAVVADALALSRSTVSSWRARGSIPAERWLDLVALGAAKHHALTLENLAVLHRLGTEGARV